MLPGRISTKACARVQRNIHGKDKTDGALTEKERVTRQERMAIRREVKSKPTRCYIATETCLFYAHVLISEYLERNEVCFIKKKTTPQQQRTSTDAIKLTFVLTR